VSRRGSKSPLLSLLLSTSPLPKNKPSETALLTRTLITTTAPLWVSLIKLKSKKDNEEIEELLHALTPPPKHGKKMDLSISNWLSSFSLPSLPHNNYYL
jgi:hypothetical protein